MNAETLLNATIGVLKRSGRNVGDYEGGGRFCLLGAMGVAVGRTPDYWAEVQDAAPEELEPTDYLLLEAGRLLAAVLDPYVKAAEFSADQVIELVSAWHDGPIVTSGQFTTYPSPQADSEVFRVLAESARLAEKTEVAA